MRASENVFAQIQLRAFLRKKSFLFSLICLSFFDYLFSFSLLFLCSLLVVFVVVFVLFGCFRWNPKGVRNTKRKKAFLPTGENSGSVFRFVLILARVVVDLLLLRRQSPVQFTSLTEFSPPSTPAELEANVAAQATGTWSRSRACWSSRKWTRACARRWTLRASTLSVYL